MSGQVNPVHVGRGAAAAAAPLVAAAAIVVAPLLVTGVTVDRTEVAEVGLVAAGALVDAHDNIVGGVTALAEALYGDPTIGDLAQQIATQDRSLDVLTQLQSAQDAILAHTGTWSTTIDEWFFAPVNEQWLTASAAVLEADQAFVDVFAADGAVAAELLTARFDVLTAEIGLLGAAFSSMPIVFAGLFFGA